MEEQSCVLLENGRRISAFASQLPFMRGTALTPDPSIKNRQAPCGACRVMKVKTCFDTKCTPGQPFVIKFELLLNSAHP